MSRGLPSPPLDAAADGAVEEDADLDAEGPFEAEKVDEADTGDNTAVFVVLVVT
jgi:hypothetical protein